MAQEALPLQGESPAQVAEQPPIQPEGTSKKKRAKRKTAKKKAGKKKTGKKASKKTGKKASKKAGKKRAKKASKKTSQASAIMGCEAVTHILPIRELAVGEPLVEAWDGEKWVPINKPPEPYPDDASGPLALPPKPPRGALTSNGARARRQKTQKAVALGVGAAAVVAGGIYLLTRRKSVSGPVQGPIADAPGAVGAPGGVALPPPIPLGNIPPAYTRIYQLFDRFVEGG